MTEKRDNAYKVGSLFSGIGGGDLGFERAGFEVAWQVEIEPSCQRVLKRHWPEAALFEDVREVGARNLAPVDVVIFGSPCQDLSIAGRREGLSGERSGLFYEAIRIIRETKPALAVWENVPGALSSNDGRDFRSVLLAFRECGARDIAWRILDARYFGVAQRRRRVFLVADFGGERAAEILFERESLRGDTPEGAGEGEGYSALAGTLSANGGGTTRPAGNANELDFCIPAFSRSETTREGFRREPSAETLIPVAFGISDQPTPKVGIGMMPTLDSSNSKNGGGRSMAVAYGLELSNQGSGGNVGWFPADGPSRTLDTNGPPGIAFGINGSETAYTLRANPSHSGDKGDGGVNTTLISAGMAVRRLMPVECERLQGFPEGWTAIDFGGKPISDSARYAMLGNAWCVPVAEWKARRIMAILKGGAA